jgi:hypothetical protein
MPREPAASDAKVAAAEVLERERRRTAELHEPQRRHDVRMGELAKQVVLASDARTGAGALAELGLEHLESYDPAGGVRRAPHFGAAAPGNELVGNELVGDELARYERPHPRRSAAHRSRRTSTAAGRIELRFRS